MELSLQVQQKQILSQKMQQSVEILQMNAVTLSEYIREFAEENPLVEWNEEKEPVQQENTELLQKLELPNQRVAIGHAAHRLPDLRVKALHPE